MKITPAIRFHVFLLLPLALASMLLGEPALDKKSGEWERNTASRDLFAAGSATTVTGTVLSTNKLGVGPDGEGVQVRVSTGDGDLTVHMAPRWFILENDLNLTRGERLNIVGVKIQFNRKPVIMATEVEQRNRKVILRDLATGQPRWNRK